VFAVAEPRPEIDAPGGGPSGGLIAADFERFLRGGGELRRIARVDLPARIEPEQVRNVAMVDVLRLEIPVFEPFL